MRRVLRASAKIAAAILVLVVAVAAGVVVYLRTPGGRRMVATRVNAALEPLFAGRLTITQIGAIGFESADGITATVVDPEGRTVISAEGAHGRIALLTLLRSLLGHGEIVVELTEASVRLARVDLDANDAGDMRIARAFAPRTVTSGGPPGRPVRVTLADMRLERGHVQGKPNGVPRIDADVAGAQGWLHVQPGSIEIDVSRATVSEAAVPGLGARATGTVTTHIAMPSAAGRKLGLTSTFDGRVGALPLTAAVTLDGEDLDVKVDGEHATPECVRSVWAACPFTEEASLHAHGQGTLPKLDFDAKATLGGGRLEIDKGAATLGAGISATAHLVFASIDARAFAPSAPVSDMSGSADLSVTVPVQGAASGHVDADLAAGRFAGQPTPAANVRGKVTFDPADPQSLRASATVDLRETGAPASVTLRLTPKNASFALAFEGRATVPNLDEVPRLGRVAHGQAAAAVEGTLDFGTNRVDAETQLSASYLSAGGASMHGASVVAHVSGPLQSPQFDAVLQGGGAEMGPMHFNSVRAASKGTMAGAPIDVTLTGSAASVHASAIASFAPAPGLRDVTVVVEKGDHHVEARASAASVAGGETRLDDVEVIGLGAPLHAALRQSPGALYVRAHSRRVDLAPIGDLLGLENTRGRMRIDVDALLRANGAQGRMQIDLHDVAFEALTGLEAHLATTLDGRHVSGTLTAEVADVGKLDVHTTSLEIGGSDPPTWSYWKRAFGSADAEAHVDLAKLSAHLPKGSMPLGADTGVVDVAAHFDRDSMSDTTPGVDLSVRTKGLVLGDGSEQQPWRIEGLDAAGRMKVDGRSGRTALELQLGDRGGPLAVLSAMSDAVPYGALFGGADLFDAVMNMPLAAQLSIPARQLATLPAFLGTQGDQGQLVADFRWVGTPLHPAIDVTAVLRGGQADVRLFALPVDVAGSGHYDGSHFGMAFAATSRGRLALQSSALFDARAEDLIRWARGGPAVWKGSVRAKLTSFPLQGIGAFDDRGVRGKVTGELVLDGWHDDAKATASLTIDGLKVGDLAYKSAKLTAAMDGKGATAEALVAQDEGFADVRATLGTHWGTAIAPTLDESRPIDLSLTAKEYRLGLLAPFVASFMSELDGRIAADIQVRVDPATHTVVPQGALAVQDGAFELVSLGGPFHDVSGQAVFSPDGVMRIGNVSARGLSGRLAAAATGRLDGHGLSALRGQVVVAQKEQLPVVFDDVQVGTFYGSISVDANRRPDGSAMDVGVDVQSMHMALPLAANRDVQALGDIQGLQVVHHGAKVLDASAETPVKTAQRKGMPINLIIDLGKDTEVKQGTTLDVVLQGKPTIALDGDVRAGGEIRLLRGNINIQGKDFTIDNGTVTFMGDPTNPQVALTAKWAAPDQTIIYADFIGPLKTGKVTLHSDPSHTQQEILAYILFGTADDPNAAGSTQTAGGSQGLNVVGGAAGAAATQPINRMLDSFGLAGGLSTKIDTSGTSPRPEVEVRIARDITLQVAWVLGVPPPGTNPDQTLVTLNWHFLRKWSIETTVGDAGTSIVDLIWQQRY